MRAGAEGLCFASAVALSLKAGAARVRAAARSFGDGDRLLGGGGQAPLHAGRPRAQARRGARNKLADARRTQTRCRTHARTRLPRGDPGCNGAAAAAPARRAGAAFGRSRARSRSQLGLTQHAQTLRRAGMRNCMMATIFPLQSPVLLVAPHYVLGQDMPRDTSANIRMERSAGARRVPRQLEHKLSIHVYACTMRNAAFSMCRPLPQMAAADAPPAEVPPTEEADAEAR
eukprot:6208779-Pleurochrysis_carterae.AAC.2